MVTDGKFDVDKRCQQIKDVEAKIKELKETKLQPLEDLKDRLRATVLKWLQDNNLQSTKTELGFTPYQSDRINYQVQDQAVFRDNIIEKQAWHLVYWSKTVAEAVRVEQLKTVQAMGYSSIEAWQKANTKPDQKPPLPPCPPGIYPNQETVLGLKSPPKPKTEGEKTPAKTSEEVTVEVL